jgi:hypothetical protein
MVKPQGTFDESAQMCPLTNFVARRALITPSADVHPTRGRSTA